MKDTLTEVVFLTHLPSGRITTGENAGDLDGHWVAVTHSLEDRAMTVWDSLDPAGTSKEIEFDSANLKLRLQSVAVDLIRPDSASIVSAVKLLTTSYLTSYLQFSINFQKPHITHCYTGRQGLDAITKDEAALNSCGFWALATALVTTLGGSKDGILESSSNIKESFNELQREYWTGGITQRTISRELHSFGIKREDVDVLGVMKRKVMVRHVKNMLYQAFLKPSKWVTHRYADEMPIETESTHQQPSVKRSLLKPLTVSAESGMLVDLTHISESESDEPDLIPRSWDEVGLMMFDRERNMWPWFLDKGDSLGGDDRKLVSC